jgi:hypothetical protein
MTSEPKRRWRQFSLRGLLLLVTVAATVSGWFAWRLQQGRIQDEAASAIERAGGAVAYSNQFYGGISRLTPYAPRSSWLGGNSNRLFGTDPFRKIVSVTLHDDASASLVSKYGLTKLEVIRLEGSQITDAALAHVRECRRTKVLLLDGSQATDDGLENIRRFGELEEMWLFNTQISDAGLQKLTHLKSLSVLDIRGTQVTDDGLKIVASLPAISLLYLDSDRLTDEGLQHLRAAPHLVSLWLGERSSAEFEFGILREFPALEDLSLLGSLVTDDALKSLTNNDKLEHLQLQDCSKLTDESLATIAQMPNLKMLHLMRSPFSAKATNEFQTNKPSCTIW